MGVPVMYAATARRSAPLSRAPCARMAPVTRLSRIARGDRARSASIAGARASAVPV
jgi:hypothetical protein